MEEDSVTNTSMEAEVGQSFLEMELEALQAIYVNEVEVIHNEDSTSVSIDLHPATADKLDEQYVKMTLTFTLDDEYPHNIPEISIRNPRGLSDEKLISITQDLKSIAEDKIGNNMLFEVIGAAKEHLTLENRPCGECAICLYSFVDKDVFTKTNCYHYFHSHCLARYSKTFMLEEVVEDEPASGEEEVKEKELLCPVCRLTIHFEGSEEDFPSPSLLEEKFEISEDVLNVQKKMADLFQKQVDKGGIIDLEAEKNKYLLEISTVPSRTTEDFASGDQVEENGGAKSQSPQKVSGKDTNLDPNNFSKSKESTTKTNKSYNKQNRNNYNDKPNKRYDNSKPKYNKDGTSKDSLSPSKDTEKDSEDPDFVSKASGHRSDGNSYRKNERRNNNYGPPRRYEDDYGRGNYNRYPDNRGNRGRRYPTNGYDRRNFRGHGYRGRGGRSNSEREAVAEQNHHDSKTEEPAPATEEKKELPECSSKDDERNDHERNRQNPRKKYPDGERDSRNKQDGHPDRDYRGSRPEDEEVGERGDNYRSYPRQGSYRDKRQYSDIRYSQKDRYSERDSYPQRRGGYGARDNAGRGSYGRGRNRGTYGNSVRRQNSEEDAQEGPVRGEDSRDGGEDRNNRYPASQRRQFSDQPYRGRGNARRNGNSQRQNSQHFDEKRDDYRNGVEDCKEEKDSHPGVSSDAQAPVTNKNEGQRNDDSIEETSSKRYSNRNSQDHVQQRYEDRRDHNPPRGGYRDSDRNRQNSDNYENRGDYNSQRGFRDSDRNKQNSDGYRKNQRYSNDRPYRNKSDSYQYKNNSTRKYNNDYYPEASDSFAGKQVERQNSELPSDESRPEKSVAPSITKVTDSTNEKGHLSKESSFTQSSESPCKDVPPSKMPAAKPNANFSSNSPKMQQPPPGFSNPLKKVVYGLQAANPPPGFPRS